MKYTVSERTITVETTEPGEQLTRETVQALTGRDVHPLALAAPEPMKMEQGDLENFDKVLDAMNTPIDMTPDPLEDLSFTDVSPEVLANEFAGYDLATMVPANIMAAE